ncbi:S8 family serine peptidase [Rossellomorea aquimaris]|uniref:Peptidase Vpr n=1 Tax=Rossellomorea aquimaris TaxID=189382 RepID=A0A366EZQ6_9BACI|nr:S8 family serine peptidase [Rossellomorea aquimaris]RBP07902.1 peptidase Vpr [Rossellomorea aquimaris]
MNPYSIVKRSAVIALSTGLLLSPVNTLSTPTVTATDLKSEDILASLTEEQRFALKQLELNKLKGLQGFNESELNSEEEITVIVEFHSKPSDVAVLEAAVEGKKLKKEEAKAKVDNEHNVFKQDVEKHLSNLNNKEKKALPEITQTYKTAYNGVAIKLPANQVEQLLHSKAVKAVYKNQTFMVDPVKMALPTDIDRNITTSVESLPYLKVDELHQEGITGEGIKVGVLDTGVDYKHPDLKDAYKGGYDFVDNDNDPMEATYEDWKDSSQPELSQVGSTYYTSHGTHVSGTIVGQNKNDSEVSVEGVAPDADLYAYRVLGPYGSGSSEGVIAGIERSVVDEMDVINLSLGASINDPYYPTSTALNYAVLNGVTTVVSAGNSGSNDFTLGSPGTAALALTVGASDVPVSQTTFTGELPGGWSTDVISMGRGFAHQFASLDDKSLELVDVGLGNMKDYENKDVEGKIVFVQRGDFALIDKVRFAKENGAEAVIMYNNVEGHVGYNLGESTHFIPAFSMTKKAGEELKEAILNGENTFTFSNLEESFSEGDKLADFSSRGPVNKNYDMKPEIVAPGVSVLSTFPSYMVNPENPEDYKYAYARLNGTSMASPFAAGVAALLLGENSDLEPSDIKTILMNSADPLNEDYSVFEVGAGRIDPYQALHSQTKIQVNDETLLPNGENLITIKEQTGGLSFDNQIVSEGSHIRVKKTLEFTNDSSEKKSYNVEVLENVQEGTNSLKENGVQVNVDKSIKVNAGKSKKSNVFLTMPKTAKKGIYEGYLVISNSNDSSESYRVPFSVKKSEEGFNSLDLLTPAITPSHYNHAYDQYRTTTALVLFNLSSPVDTLDVILQDGKSGEDLGLIGTLNLNGAEDNRDYFLQAFNGNYYKFTGDKKDPVASETSIAQPGHYKLKFISTLPSGKQKIIMHDLFIDIEAPEVKSSLDSESPFIEYKPGQQTVPFEMEVTDPNVEAMQNAGLDIDQSSNFAVYTYGAPFPNGPIYMDKNGKWNEEVEMNEKTKSLSFNLIGYDAAGNQAKWKEYFFLKEGTPVTYAKHNVETARSGDILTASLVLDNLDGVKEATWSFDNSGIQHVYLVEAALTNEVEDYASIEVDGNQVKVKFDENKAFDQIEVVDVKVKVQDELFYPIGFIKPTAKIINENNEEQTLLSAGNRYNLKPRFNRVQGNLIPEGYLVESGGFAGYRDWAKVGASIKVTNPSGYELNASDLFNGNARFEIEPLPLSNDAYTFEVNVPGHFITKYDKAFGFEYKGTLYGKSDTIGISLVGGDVNQDHVIDIHDAIAIQEAWGTDERAADINFDTVVNEKDLSFVEKNYLQQNEDATNPPAPTDSWNGKTLESIKKELGL